MMVTAGHPRIPLLPVDAVRITTVMDNYADNLIPNEGPATRARGVATRPPPKVIVETVEGGTAAAQLRAEHGFSALLTLVTGGRERTILFDTGVTPDGILRNMDWLGLTPKNAEAIVLSHGHFDHTAGMAGLIQTLGRANLPVIIHPEFWNRRRLAFPGTEPSEIPTTSKPALRGAGFEIVEERHPSFILDGALLITGEVDRTTAFETGYPIHEKFEAGAWVPDPLILDDQAAIVHVRDRGLVVLTGCGHAGIVNIVRYARRLTGVERVYAVIGGFHLGGPIFEPVIPPVVAALRELAPAVIVPAHCTGPPAMRALAAAMPEAYIQNAVGTRLNL